LGRERLCAAQSIFSAARRQKAGVFQALADILADGWPCFLPHRDGIYGELAGPEALPGGGVPKELWDSLPATGLGRVGTQSLEAAEAAAAESSKAAEAHGEEALCDPA
jgi:hypothetical protein